jgi:hypothetical protein
MKNRDYRSSEVASFGHFRTIKFQNKTSIQIKLAIKNVFTLTIDKKNYDLHTFHIQIVILFSVIYVVIFIFYLYIL